MIPILSEDDSLIVCVKPAGLLAEDGDDPSEYLPAALRRQTQTDALFTVHRLDRVVGGVMVYAKTKSAATAFGRQIQQTDMFKKEYLAVISGVPAQRSAVWEDLLFADKRAGKAYVADSMRAGVKQARLSYQVIDSVCTQIGSPLSLVKVNLYTGRFHQIRVQFASRGFPIAGDGKYGSRCKCPQLALFSAQLSFQHPVEKKQRTFSALPVQISPWTYFDSSLLNITETKGNG